MPSYIPATGRTLHVVGVWVNRIGKVCSFTRFPWLLIDLSGVEFGRAFLAAINILDKEKIRCMVADFILQGGILASRTLVVNTTDHVITGGGRIDLSREVLEMHLRTDAKHFPIGTLAAPIRAARPAISPALPRLFQRRERSLFDP
jgi:hypothetical protein